MGIRVFLSTTDFNKSFIVFKNKKVSFISIQVNCHSMGVRVFLSITDFNKSFIYIYTGR